MSLWLYVMNVVSVIEADLFIHRSWICKRWLITVCACVCVCQAVQMISWPAITRRCSARSRWASRLSSSLRKVRRACSRLRLCLCYWTLTLSRRSSAGLPKSSEQAYIEFENIEAIVKTASRTKFFIEFYSTCLEGKKPNHSLPPTRKFFCKVKISLSSVEIWSDQCLISTCFC